MQHVVYAKSSKVFAATSCCLLFIAMNRIKLSMRRLSTVKSQALFDTRGKCSNSIKTVCTIPGI